MQVITETLRLANPVTLLWREATEDVQLNGELHTLLLLNPKIVNGSILLQIDVQFDVQIAVLLFSFLPCFELHNPSQNRFITSISYVKIAPLFF
jgi:hypothetical protein